MNVRRPTETDLGAVLELMAACDLADAGESDAAESEMRAHWRELDLERDAWVVELDGSLAGYADFQQLQGGRLMADGYVHPLRRGRGIGAELVRLTEARAAERLPEVDGRIYLQNATLADAAAFYEPRGYRPIRRFRRMAIDLDRTPGVEAPEGVALRPLTADDARAVHAAMGEAFADHWEHRPRTFEEYSERTFAREDYDPSLCILAEADGEVAGASLNWWKDIGGAGWIGTVGVRPAFRGRGIGAALVLASFAEFMRRGEPRIALGVDAQNETGAVRLYERLGMRTVWEAVVWEKELRAA
jgi:mycothiol synthase